MLHHHQGSTSRHLVLLLALVLGCAAVASAGISKGSSSSWRYAVIIDAGSTGSRAHVFRYQQPAPLPAPNDPPTPAHKPPSSSSTAAAGSTTAATTAASSAVSPYPIIELPEAVHKSSPGLSAFAGDPRAAGASLQPLVKFAKGKVPAAQWRITSIQLMATAGLRLLNSSSTASILAEVDKVLSASGFQYNSNTSKGHNDNSNTSNGQQHHTVASNNISDSSSSVGVGVGVGGARVLSGAEEGLLGWVALNYATGALQAATSQQQHPQQQHHHQRLGRKDTPTTKATSSSSSIVVPLQGVLELGGGSLQVTFMPPVPPPSPEAAPLVLPPPLGPGRLYSRSFDGLGLQAAMSKWSAALSKKKAQHDPCMPAGYKPPPPPATAAATASTTAAATASSSGAANSSNGSNSIIIIGSSSNGPLSLQLAGSGDWAACKAGVAQLVLPKKTCPHKPPTRCGLAGSFLPTVEGKTFVGLDNLFYTASLLGLPTTQPSSLQDLDKAAAAFCGATWSHITSHLLKNNKQAWDPQQAYHTRVCFSAALILGVLGPEGLHLPPKKPLLTASNSITTPGGKTLEAKWPLGALVIGLLQQQQQTHQQQQEQQGGEKTASVTTAAAPQKHAAGTTAPAAVQGGAAAGKQERQQPPSQQLQQPQQQEDTGLSAGNAAALAAAFCMSLFALMLCASWLGVGLPSSSSSSSSGRGWCWLWWQRMQRTMVGGVAGWLCGWRGGGRGGSSSSSGGGGVGSGGLIGKSGGGGAGSSSSVRYMRVSRSDGFPRPRSRSPSPLERAGRRGGGGGASGTTTGTTASAGVGGAGDGGESGTAGSVMLTVLSPNGAAASSVSGIGGGGGGGGEDRSSRGNSGVSSTVVLSSTSSKSGGRPLIVQRQR